MRRVLRTSSCVALPLAVNAWRRLVGTASKAVAAATPPHLPYYCLHCDAPALAPAEAADHHNAHTHNKTLTFTGRASLPRVLPTVPCENRTYVLIDVANARGYMNTPSEMPQAARDVLIDAFAAAPCSVVCIHEGEATHAAVLDVLSDCVHASRARQPPGASGSTFHHVRVDGQPESGDYALVSALHFLLRSRDAGDARAVLLSRDHGLVRSAVDIFGSHRVRPVLLPKYGTRPGAEFELLARLVRDVAVGHS